MAAERIAENCFAIVINYLQWNRIWQLFDLRSPGLLRASSICSVIRSNQFEDPFFYAHLSEEEGPSRSGVPGLSIGSGVLELRNVARLHIPSGGHRELELPTPGLPPGIVSKGPRTGFQVIR